MFLGGTTVRKCLILIALLVLFSCSKKQELQIDKGTDGLTTLRFKADAQYLLLPMEDRGEEKRMDVRAGGASVNTFVIRPARNQVDYWMPLELTPYDGESVEILLDRFEGYELFLSEVKLSGSFEYDQHEKYRPLFHFSPPWGWTNDPNGMVYYDGEFHLSYQYNPFGTKWQNMSWGHAVSRDLVTWEHLPISLWPDTLGTIFSGSAEVDVNNTTGLQEGNEKSLLAYFTHAGPKGQFQSLAFSNDRGRSWTKYPGNPVLANPGKPDFRDPKVFRNEETGRWNMILAVGQVMEIYSSTDGIRWSYESRFGEGEGSHGGVWECPDLFQLPVEGESESHKWVLICNINPGGPSGGSATQYFIGDFDGKVFTHEGDPKAIRWMDWGKDNYATVTWSNVPESDGRRLAIGWMSNWEYANDVPTKHFRNAMTVVREMKLIRKGEELVLASYPVKELEKLRKSPVTVENIMVDKEFAIDSLLPENKGAYEIIMEVRALGTEAIGFSLSNGSGERVEVSLNLVEGTLTMDRTASGMTSFSERFPVKTTAPIAKKEEYTLRLLVDKASVEIFEGSGETVMTNLVFPSEPYHQLQFHATGKPFELKSLRCYALN